MDTKKKHRIYAIMKLGLAQKDRLISLGFELPIPGNGARKAC
jgi:hypothetical protein